MAIASMIVLGVLGIAVVGFFAAIIAGEWEQRREKNNKGW